MDGNRESQEVEAKNWIQGSDSRLRELRGGPAPLPGLHFGDILEIGIEADTLLFPLLSYCVIARPILCWITHLYILVELPSDNKSSNHHQRFSKQRESLNTSNSELQQWPQRPQ